MNYIELVKYISSRFNLDCLKSIKSIINSDGFKLAISTANSQETKLFHDFTKMVNKERRFFCQHQFLEVFKKLYFEELVVSLNANDMLYRARKDEYGVLTKKYKHEDGLDFKGFSKKDSFVPPPKDIVSSRIVPSGISCLYAASTKHTAIIETRPYKQNNVSVAEIRPKKELKIFDLHYDRNDTIGKMRREKKMWFTWFKIALLFAKPVENNKDEYIITQCIAEYIKNVGGFDGIQYSSSLDKDGKNIVIFDCKHENYEICEPISSDVYTVNQIGFSATNVNDEDVHIKSDL